METRLKKILIFKANGRTPKGGRWRKLSGQLDPSDGHLGGVLSDRLDRPRSCSKALLRWTVLGLQKV